MSAGFCWSLADVLTLARFATKIHQALKEEGGSSSEYQQATSTSLSLPFTLEQIKQGLNSTDPSFRNALRGQLDGPTSSIAEFNARLQERYGNTLGTAAISGRHNGTWRKIKWAFSATKDLIEFLIGLSWQLEIVKLLIISETKSDVAASDGKLTATQ